MDIWGQGQGSLLLQDQSRLFRESPKLHPIIWKLGLSKGKAIHKTLQDKYGFNVISRKYIYLLVWSYLCKNKSTICQQYKKQKIQTVTIWSLPMLSPANLTLAKAALLFTSSSQGLLIVDTLLSLNFHQFCCDSQLVKQTICYIKFLKVKKL